MKNIGKAVVALLVAILALAIAVNGFLIFENEDNEDEITVEGETEAGEEHKTTDNETEEKANDDEPDSKSSEEEQVEEEPDPKYTNVDGPFASPFASETVEIDYETSDRATFSSPSELEGTEVTGSGSIEWTPSEAGTYNVELDGPESASEKIEVRKQPEPTLETSLRNNVEEDGVFPEDARTGTTHVLADYEIENKGDGEVRDTIDVYINGELYYESIEIGVEDKYENVVRGIEFTKEHEPYANLTIEYAGESTSHEVPVLVDRSGDGLYSYWELNEETFDGVELPDADPDQRDVYVEVVNGEDLDLEKIEKWFDNFPTKNPDGTEGVNIHFMHGLDEAIDHELPPLTETGGTPDEYSEIELARHFYDYRIGPRQALFVTEFEIDLKGFTTMDGFSWVDKDILSQEHTATHEILHNMAGERVSTPDCHGRAHTCEGFLSYSGDTFMSDATANHLDNNPFYYPNSRYTTFG